jgi:hypothetical protein
MVVCVCVCVCVCHVLGIGRMTIGVALRWCLSVRVACGQAVVMIDQVWLKLASDETARL